MKFTELVDIGELQELCKDFTSTTGMPTAILDPEGNILTSTGWQDICTRFHRVNPITAARCRESDTILAGGLKQGEKVNVYKCNNGLVDVAVPIKVQGEHVANFFTGQFFLEPPDQEFFIQQAEEFGFDKEAYMDALQSVPILSSERLNSLMNFFSRLGRLFGEMGLATKQLEEANTEIQQEAKRSRESEEKFRTLTETSPLAIVMTSGVEQVIDYINPAAVKLFGYTHDEIPTAEQWWPLAYPDEDYRNRIVKEWQQKVEHAIATDSEIEPVETIVTCKDGLKKTILWHFSAVGKQNWVLGLDLTERRQAELLLEEKVKDLEEVVYVASHDLRSPLVTIEGFGGVLKESLEEISTVLEKEELSQQTRDLLAPFIKDSHGAIKYISTSVSRMASLLHGLLQVSRLAKVGVNKETLDMNKLMSEVLADFKQQTEKQGVKIEVSTMPTCEGDSTQVGQIFSNLVGNAIKYSDPDRPCVIKVSGEKEGDHSVYCVEDNGLGIAPEYQKQIFEIFHQLDREEDGEGLGLSIVRKITERHDGKIWVESVLGQGSKFYVSFPKNINANLDS